jgi:hypothetical protein
MLRLGRHFPGKKTWGPAHMKWLMPQKLEHREQRIALEELLGADARTQRRQIDETLLRRTAGPYKRVTNRLATKVSPLQVHSE